jgi:hypothetical protein
MQIYDKPVRELFKEFLSDAGLRRGEVFNRKRVVSWFNERYPKIKKGTITAHLLMLSINAPSRVHYTPRANGQDDLFFQIDPSHFRLYEPGVDPSPIQKTADNLGDSIRANAEEDYADEVTEGREFAYERDLKNYLAKNLNIIEPGLRLYEEEGITGLEFPAGGRFIDILGVDKGNDYVVIELKVSKGYDRVIGQLLRYMAWIEKNHAEPNQGVRGIIIASSISEDLILASSKINDVELFEYQLSITLKNVKPVLTENGSA